MNVVVVEDSGLVLEALLGLLPSRAGMTVVGHAGGEDEAFVLITSLRPDVVLLDLALSPGSGLNLLKRLRAAGVGSRILVLTNQPAAPYRELSLAAGADGFYDKCANLDGLFERLSGWLPPQPDDEADRQRALWRLNILESPAEEVFDSIAQLAAAVAATPIALISMVDEQRQWFKARVGLEVCGTSRSVSFCAHAVAQRRFFEVEDAALDPRFSDNPMVRGEPNIRFYAGVPLIMPSGAAIGTLCVIDRVPRRLDPTQRMALEVLARNVVAELELRQRIIELEAEVQRRHEAELRIMHLATRDPLTGLPNRAAFMDRLHQGIRAAVRAGERVGVLFIDLDRFKWINDTLGHDAGDSLLQEVATRLARLLRDSDTVARLGGDEFAVILPALERCESAETIAQKILDAMMPPLPLHGYDVHIQCSVGMAVYPEHGETEEVLLRHADLAMYEAKQSSGSRYETFSQDMNQRAVERVLLESELRNAIEQDQLELHYQPQVRLSDGTLTGLEALVRWRHPVHGLLSPDRFIAIAEDSGLIWPLGLRVLDIALAQLASWRAEGLDIPRIAVNVSPAQLRDGLVEAVTAALARHDVTPDRLELELTESALTSDGPAVLGLLRSLRDMGVAVAVDDFGVGYSSLALLRRLPIATLKIDRSFVSELSSNDQDAAIIEAVITMADSIGLRTVAEGVEELAQNVALRVLGCGEAQGYYFSRPLPPADMKRWLAGRECGAER